jgi:hypothetical protein
MSSTKRPFEVIHAEAAEALHEKNKKDAAQDEIIAEKMRVIATARADIIFAKKVKVINAQFYAPLLQELRTHPESMRVFMRSLNLPEKLIADLVDTGELGFFYTEIQRERGDDGSDRYEWIQQTWICEIDMAKDTDGKRYGDTSELFATRTLQPNGRWNRWDIYNFERLTLDDVAEARSGENLWKLALERNKKRSNGSSLPIPAALASIAFLKTAP